MLADALEHTLRSESAAHALATDVKDESAAALYQRHGLARHPIRH